MANFIVLLQFVVAFAAAQFVPAPTDLTSQTGLANITVRFKQVPAGTCEQDPSVKSYSGYADVAPDQHIFFWFFEVRNGDPSQAPLTVWLNGGPGCSSMIGAFQENGPCNIDSNGNVQNNPYSWSNVSNMLYIDQPTQTGFSYSIPVPGYLDSTSGLVHPLPNNSCPDYANGLCGTFSYPNATLTASGTFSAAPAVWATLQGFMGVFPQYARDKINLAAESYGGVFAPVFTEYFNSQSQGKQIGMDTVLIGNGFIDESIIYQSYYNFTVSPGNTYDYSPFNASIASEMYNLLWGSGNCVDQMNSCKETNNNEICNGAEINCGAVSSLYDLTGRDYYDIREPDSDPFPPQYYTDYLNSPQVLSAIGAFQNYTECSATIGFTFSDTNLTSGILIQDLQEIISQDINLVLYNGDADFICNWFGGEQVAYEIDAPGFSDAGYTNISTPDNVVHGQVKQAGTFSFVRVYESGHEVPYYQPELALTMFSRAISRKDIATGTLDANSSYISNGTSQSLFREGNSTVQLRTPGEGATYNTTSGALNSGVSRTHARSLGWITGLLLGWTVIMS
jgi:carboxypeptidase C (cathepsin A)